MNIQEGDLVKYKTGIPNIPTTAILEVLYIPDYPYNDIAFLAYDAYPEDEESTEMSLYGWYDKLNKLELVTDGTKKEVKG